MEVVRNRFVHLARVSVARRGEAVNIVSDEIPVAHDQREDFFSWSHVVEENIQKTLLFPIRSRSSGKICNHEVKATVGTTEREFRALAPSRTNL